jgi:cytoskeletal protein RodZ
MALNSVGEILRHARLAQSKSIDDVAAATRINKKFLLGIEEGNIPNLPRTYIQAFIKDYANYVGLDPAELLAETPYAPAPPPVPVAPQHDASTGEGGEAGTSVGGKLSSNVKGDPSLMLLLFSFLAVAGLVIAVVWMHSERNATPVHEISFSEAVKEQDAKRQKDLQPTVKPDSAMLARKLGDHDSLTLEATAQDSVWLRIAADSMPAREYSFAPADHRLWKARYYFMLTAGKQHALMLRLNGRPVAVPGKLTNLSLSWSDVDTMHAVAGAKAGNATKDTNNHAGSSVKKRSGNFTPGIKKKAAGPKHSN